MPPILREDKRRNFPALVCPSRIQGWPRGEKRRVQRENRKLQQSRKEKILGELLKKVRVWEDEWRGRRECGSERKKEIQELEYSSPRGEAGKSHGDLLWGTGV